MASPLADLDELVLKCRDEKAKAYINEAVSCYKSGAFRSAIVSTWIAVSFDIIDKLKELTLAGDKEAEKQLDEFEKARQTGDITKSLRFEREILQIAKNKLELISTVELIDLERLQQDRNRCAHPSMTSDGDIFNPSAELARLHIRSAVEYLLQYPPAQGKSALESLINEISSPYFPTTAEKAIIAFNNSPLVKARESLIRNLVIVILKKILEGPKDYNEKLRLSAALKAIKNIHATIYHSTLDKKLSQLIKSLTSLKLAKSFALFEIDGDIWDFLEPDIQQKLENLVENLPANNLDDLEFTLLNHSKLSAAAKKRVSRLTRHELENHTFWELTESIGNRIIYIYGACNNFEEANSFAKTMNKYALEFSKKQIEEIIISAGKNDQIKYSHEIGHTISSLRKNKLVIDTEFDEWLVSADLNRHVSEDL